MKYGFVLPSGDARTAAKFAHQAEAAGWDGFFVWEPVWGVDAWVLLTAAAMRTERIRLGTICNRKVNNAQSQKSSFYFRIETPSFIAFPTEKGQH